MDDYSLPSFQSFPPISKRRLEGLKKIAKRVNWLSVRNLKIENY